ncbi:MAG: esterase-like activity of phytase family protein [Acidovorax sp.]
MATGWQLLGEIRLEHGTLFAGTTVGGLSAIDYDAAHGQFVLLSDDRSAHDPARFYTARIDYDADGLHRFTLTGTRPLLSPQGQPYANARHVQAGVAVPDPEALRVLPSGEWLWSSEGDFSRGFGPELNAMRPDGTWLRRFALPESLQYGQGPRDNLTLEGIAVSPDGRTVWASMEGPLRQDGPLPTHERPGGPVRITAFDAATGQPLRQIAYQPDALPAAAFVPRMAVNGVSEILADGADHLLVLERSWVLGHGFGARLYRIATGDALHKTLVLDFSTLGLRTLDNLEGMAWAPPLPDGRRVLLLISDDNFNPAEVTQLVALAQCS